LSPLLDKSLFATARQRTPAFSVNAQVLTSVPRSARKKQYIFHATSSPSNRPGLYSHAKNPHHTRVTAPTTRRTAKANKRAQCSFGYLIRPPPAMYPEPAGVPAEQCDQRVREVAGAAVPYESPKLIATAIVNEGSFAELLDQRLKRIEQMKLIEAKPTTNTDKIIEGNPVDARLPPSIPDRRFRRI